MNNTFYGTNDYRSYLEHHGVLGMKWGRRKQQIMNQGKRGLNDVKSYHNKTKNKYATASSKQLNKGHSYGGLAVRHIGRGIAMGLGMSAVSGALSLAGNSTLASVATSRPLVAGANIANIAITGNEVYNEHLRRVEVQNRWNKGR